MRILITGGFGFVGSRLVSTLRDRRPEWTLFTPDPPGLPHGVDIANADEVDKCVVKFLPDLVVHLAAIAAVTASTRDPRLAWRVNLGGTLNVAIAIRDNCPNAKLVHISSSEVYGESFNGANPLKESAQLLPMNPYAASKAAADILVGQAARGGLGAIIARPFNHTGVGQGEAFAVPSFAAQIARIESGTQEPKLLVGNLDEERDFLDVQDVVDAYVALIEADCFGAKSVFNIASGNAVRIGDLLERLLSMSKVAIKVVKDSKRLRQSSVPRVVGDATALREITGWQPRIDIGETLRDILEQKRLQFA